MKRKAPWLVLFIITELCNGFVSWVGFHASSSHCGHNLVGPILSAMLGLAALIILMKLVLSTRWPLAVKLLAVILVLPIVLYSGFLLALGASGGLEFQCESFF